MNSEGLYVVLPIKRIYCLDCEWTVSTENHTRQELSTLTIEHAVEYDHDIDSEIIHVDSDMTIPTIEHPDEAKLN